MWTKCRFTITIVSTQKRIHFTQHSIHFTFSKRFQRSAFEIESDDRYLYRRTVQLYEIFLLMSLAASTVGFVVI